MSYQEFLTEFYTRDHHGISYSSEQLYSLFVHFLDGISQTWKILDVGTGTGNNLVTRLQAEGIDAWGTTVNVKDITERVKYALMHDLPFSSNEFDVVISSHSIEHTDNLMAAFFDFHRVLKEKGQLVIFCPETGDHTSFTPTHVLCPNIEQLCNIGKKLGFTPLRAYRVILPINLTEVKRDICVVFKKEDLTHLENQKLFYSFKAVDLPIDGNIQEVNLVKYTKGCNLR